MEENTPEPGAKKTAETKPRKTSLPIIIGTIVLAGVAFFGIRQIMYYTMLNEEKAKAATPKKILTRSEFKDSMVHDDDADAGAEDGQGEETDGEADDEAKEE